MANSKSQIPSGSNVDRSASSPNVLPTQESHVEKQKLMVSFDIYGNPIGPNKSKYKTRCLALVKAHVGVVHDDWRQVPKALKNDLWDRLMLDFTIDSMQKDNVTSQLAEQWRTWKKKLREKHFVGRETKQQILELKDRVPEKEPITVAEWNVFIERESTTQKLDQRAQNKANRSKKSDVHLLGAKSYAQLSQEWTEKTTGTEDEGVEPNRVNMYVYARKDKKTGLFHPNFVNNAAKISKIKSSQGECNAVDIENDALTQVFGNDNRGRTRGVGGSVSKSKIKATRPVVSELQQVKNDVKDNSRKMDTIISLLQNQNSRKSSCPSAGTCQSVAAQTSSSSHVLPLIRETECAPKSVVQSRLTVALKGFYHIRDLKNEKNVAMGKVEEVTPGTIVHGRRMKAGEVKLSVQALYQGMGDEPLYEPNDFGTTLSEVVGGYIVWSSDLLKELM